MRKIIGFLNTQMNGCDVAEAYLFDDTDSDEYINNTMHQEACQWAESYVSVVGEDEEETDDWVEGSDFVRESDIGSHWEDYNGEAHDGNRMGGGSFEDDFERLATFR